MHNSSPVNQTEEFVKQSFISKPHFSFNDWTVMYNHSVLVKDISLEIASEVNCERELLAIGALLHDIGKTHEESEEKLHTDHESFNLPISEQLLESLKLDKDKLEKLKSLVSYTSDSVEMEIIKDADAIALYKDNRLYMLFVKWAKERNLDWAVQRKLEKYNNLNFEISKKIAKPLLDQMKRDWEEYLGKSL